MLQAPASLNENGSTAGMSNVQGDELQVALHFLQALLVSPGVVRTELAPELYRTVVESCIVSLRRGLGDGFDGVKWGAMSYKAWLMYHQVISYGRSPLLMKHKAHEIR
ncbi:hypothetical protein L1987_04331 [Smallanthus sonchifolius]|uniref:Uncharacterized protein n=1 Tax=Smallanthus sonchifolius TaxID=185202 RepID=A0ACB9KD60_9ASTR|nr:hypothetical protein L1987_04331 [Smallanthus sonchifolius]